MDHPGDSQEDGDGGSQHTCHQLGDDQYGGGRAGEDGGKGDQINAGLPIDTTHESCWKCCRKINKRSKNMHCTTIIYSNAYCFFLPF